MPDDGQKVGLSKEQKTGFVLLSIFAIFAIGLGVLQIRNTMYSPFALNNSIPPTISDDINSPEYLQYRDTDVDGLNDFEELYVYGTSPYLADTDSDGITDKQEMDKGTNPNCAEGKDCTGMVNNAEWESNTSTIEVSVENPGDTPPIDINALLKDPTQIRQMLLKNGADEKTLEKFSDKDLLDLVDQVMLVSSTSSNTNQFFNNSTSSTR